MEWALGPDNRLYVLQARDVTTSAKATVWSPPDPDPEKTWLYDSVHFPGANARLSWHVLEEGLTMGFRQSAEVVGALLAGLVYRMVNGCIYEYIEHRDPQEVL
jgi:hypothetical protein